MQLRALLSCILWQALVLHVYGAKLTRMRHDPARTPSGEKPVMFEDFLLDAVRKDYIENEMMKQQNMRVAAGNFFRRLNTRMPLKSKNMRYRRSTEGITKLFIDNLVEDPDIYTTDSSERRKGFESFTSDDSPIQSRHSTSSEEEINHVNDGQSIIVYGSERQRNERKNLLSEALKYSCGSFVIMSLGETVTLKLGDIEETDCVVNVTINQREPHSFYFTLEDRIMMQFPHCSSMYLTIENDGYCQRYCGGNFTMTELPGDIGSNHISFHLHSEHSLRDVEIFLQLSSRYASDHNLDINSVRSFVPYQDWRSVRNQTGVVTTFNLQDATFQVCPGLCGTTNLGIDDLHRDFDERSEWNDAKFGAYPWMVLVRFFCVTERGGEEYAIAGGVILNAATVMTSAHPFHNETCDNVYIVVSTRPHPDDFLNQMTSSKEYRLHRDFEKKGDMYFNDLMVLVLREKLSFLGEEASPTCLGPITDYHGMAFYSFHYSKQGAEDDIYDYVLRKEEHILEDSDSCAMVPTDSPINSTEFICFYIGEGSELSTGSSLLLRGKNVWYLFGIVSNVISNWAIATNITNYFTFIHQASQQLVPYQCT